jgi:hypothetical protein
MFQRFQCFMDTFHIPDNKFSTCLFKKVVFIYFTLISIICFMSK